VTITLKDERPGEEREETFHARGGLREMVAHITARGNKKPLHQEVVYIETERDGIGIELAMQYNDSYAESVFSFVNNINTHEGGTHLTGFKSALTSVVNKYIERSNALAKKDKDIRLSGDDVREGLVSVLSVKVREPQFEGQTKTKLGNSEAEGAVRSVVNELLSQYLDEHPKVANAVIEKAVSAARAREAARKARDLTRKKSALDVGNLPGKLADCSLSDPRSARSTSSRATRRAARRRWGATGSSRPSCRCAARSSTSRRRASTRCSPTRRSAPSSRRWARASRTSSTSSARATTRS
jgi:DNA gyrase subunit B